MIFLLVSVGNSLLVTIIPHSRVQVNVIFLDFSLCRIAFAFAMLDTGNFSATMLKL